MYTLVCILYILGGFLVFLGILGSISEEDGAIGLGLFGFILIIIGLIIAGIVGG